MSMLAWIILTGVAMSGIALVSRFVSSGIAWPRVPRLSVPPWGGDVIPIATGIVEVAVPST
ncbi:MAG: hypothetical protein OER90_05485 [Gemmatimonadota bacterium]|nr:hypothetical protein [Gemmatimonadota bacterium]